MSDLYQPRQSGVTDKNLWEVYVFLTVCVHDAEHIVENKYLLMNQGTHRSITDPGSLIHQMKAVVGKDRIHRGAEACAVH